MRKVKHARDRIGRVEVARGFEWLSLSLFLVRSCIAPFVDAVASFTLGWFSSPWRLPGGRRGGRERERRNRSVVRPFLPCQFPLSSTRLSTSVAPTILLAASAAEAAPFFIVLPCAFFTFLVPPLA